MNQVEVCILRKKFTIFKLDAKTIISFISKAVNFKPIKNYSNTLIFAV
jgi:hypothetical protein